MAAAEQATVFPAEPLVETGPFKFLDFFADTPEDRRRFGGREREIRELVARIANEWTLVLYGRSGIGKTSLLLAGVFPEFETRGYRAVYARTLTDPIRDLCRAVGDKCGTKGPEEDLRSAVEKAVAGGPLVIVLDQFEEFFIRFRENPETRAAFIEAVGSLVNDRSLDLTVVFSLREDYIAALDDFRERIPDLFENQYRLRPLTAFGVRQAISRPLTDAGISYDEAVVSRVVDQLEDSSFDPPVLQIICSELYREAVERAAGEVPRITLEDVKKVGDLDDIFHRCLDGLGKAIPLNQTLLARMILDALITGDNTKQAVTVEDLLAAQFSAQKGEVREILDILVKQRLLRRQLRDGTSWYELIHERLVPHLKKWLDSDQRFYEFRQARDFVETSGKTDLWMQKPEALLNAGVLSDLLGPHKERFRFRARECELIFRSAMYRHSPEVDFWAKRLGTREAIRMLLNIMVSPNWHERNGAAISAGLLSDPERELASACLNLALNDAEETVRRSAGRSLARLARTEEIISLRAALRNKQTRRRARQTLTDLRLGGHSLKEFSWLRRRFAGEEAERRLHVEYKEIIHARRKTGALQGLLASLAWVLLVGVPLAAFGVGFLGVNSDQEWYQKLAATLGTMLPAAAVFGALLGGILASAVARDAIATGEDGHWARAFLGSRPFFYGTILVGEFGAISLFIFNSEVKSFAGLVSGVGAAIVLSAPLAILLSIGLGASLLWNRATIWPPESRMRLWLWSLTAGLGTSGFLMAFISLGFLIFDKNSLSSAWAFDFLLAWLTGLAVCVSLIAISASEYKHPIRHLPEPSAWRRRGGRLGAIGGALLATAWAVHFLHSDMIPAFAVNKHYDPAKGIELRGLLGTRFPDMHYFRLCNATDSPQFAVSISDYGTLSLGSGVSPYLEDIILLPPGCHLGSFHQYEPDLSSDHNLNVRLIPILELHSEEGFRRLSNGGLVIAPLVLRFSPTKSRPWVGTIQVKLPGPEKRGRILLVYPQWYKLSGAALAAQGGVHIFANNDLNEGDAFRETKLAPPPKNPIWIDLQDNYWPVLSENLGNWQIEFRVLGTVPRSDLPIEEVTIPVLLRIVDLNDKMYFAGGKLRSQLEGFVSRQEAIRKGATLPGQPTAPPSGKNSVPARLGNPSGPPGPD
ncbi:MAG TPA: ATP-binding protein [Thermoanaerobaculia bacterium]|nr:ATP-binding protein [Thermoanaerobaculia bacterium]